MSITGLDSRVSRHKMISTEIDWWASYDFGLDLLFGDGGWYEAAAVIEGSLDNILVTAFEVLLL
jgi:hypothetical protein